MHCDHQDKNYTRRDFLTRTSLGLGAVAMGSFLDPMGLFGKSTDPGNKGILGGPHFSPKAKRVIYLFQSGGPSHLDLFDYKPLLNKMNGEDLPESVRQGQRLTGMTSGQASFPLAGSQFGFKQYGESGAWVSELMPHTARIVDELCFIKSMYTEAINHDPAVTFIQTGSELPGRPSIGSWFSYGLGSDNENLPAFVVLVTKNKFGQPLYARLWGNGFLPSQHQGVQFRAGKNPVLYLNNPPGVTESVRRDQLDHLQQLEQLNFKDVGDPEIMARMSQYEMAYRMQTSVPEIMDTSSEPDRIYDMYGPDSRNPGTYAANCLLARRLAERDVKFIQLYHQGWDQHGNLPKAIGTQCLETDQATAALITDLKQRGLLEDTLVIWGGEFGRTSYSQGQLTSTNYGRDHHPRCFTVFMAGAGVKKGYILGETDDFGYSIIKDPVHVHDFQATLMHLLGIDHERLTFKFQGRRYRLTDVHGELVKQILA
ncbi:MAG: sulfatase [Cyclobacteriaceae bacterium]|nr:MAG: sulfatase [Cyclobacteriaceae bacterium]